MHFSQSSQVELNRTDNKKLVLEKLSKYMDDVNLEKISRINNYELLKWILEVVELVRPRKVFVVTENPEDLEYIRRVAVERKEEYPSKYNPRHTVHMDGPRDLARDRENTRILVTGYAKIPMINTKEKMEGLAEIREVLKGIMENKEMFIGLYCFGPKNSPFSLYGVQVTDSAYVIHSSNILYRICYDVFTTRNNIQFMRFLHSAGERDENGWSRNIHKRRIYIDPEENIVYSVNTQYAGNTVGLKKLSLRLCVYKGYRESWLCEHMFIIGVKGPGDRISYFTGAFPAGCGKTSTALIADTVVGDDLAIIRNVNGEARAINPEIGMFGIIDGVNPRDDPEIYEILTSRETEVIFANVLLTDDGDIWWNGKPYPPKPGINYAGRWTPGMSDENGVEIPPSHPNGRFTTSIFYLKRVDPRIEDPLGVPVKGMIFGGRDPDTWVPVEESFDWDHGIVTKGASLESERTAAVLGQVGKMEFNPFAMLDFLSISPGAFVELHFRFGKLLREKPRIFGVNYFIRDENGKYLTDKTDKLVWLKWMELRVNNDVEAIETPTGLIPIYGDLAELFGKYLNKEFSETLYIKLFSTRISKHLEKIERIWKIYEAINDTPRKLFEILMWQKKRLEDARMKHGDVINPFSLDRK
ncbi:MAG: phosphoenolpyruvate carboxykinase (GTP) [Desulfurococcaceae archaeon]